MTRKYTCGETSPRGQAVVEKIQRLLRADDGQAELNGIAFELGLVTMQADAATVRARLRRYVEEHQCR
jgi:hypothetical protein